VPLIVRELTNDEYSQWDDLAAISPQRTIFAQRWWMEIVTHGQGRLLGCFDGDRLIAGMPIWPCRSLGVMRLRQPPLTPYWGPLFRPLEGKPLTQTGAGMQILRALAEALSPWSDIVMQWHHSLSNWMPFYWKGFTQTTRYTYRYPDMSDLARIANNRQNTIGQKLRRAERDGLHLEDMIDPVIAARLNRLSMARQGVDSSEEIQRFWPELTREALARHCLFTTAAIDEAGEIHSAAAMVWDNRCAYGILSGVEPRFRGSNAGTLIMWREIEYAATVAPEFDFEGSMVEGVEQFYRSFGGELCPYLLVTRSDSFRLNLARKVQSMARMRRKK